MHIVIFIKSISFIICIVGLYLLYKHGISPNVFKDGQVYFYEAKELQQKKEKRKNQEKKARLGFILSVFGVFLNFLVELFNAN